MKTQIFLSESDYQQLNKLLAQASSYDLTALMRVEALGIEYGFAELEEYISEFLRIIKYCKTIDYSIIPRTLSHVFTVQLKEVVKALDQLETFNLDVQNPRNKRTNLINEVKRTIVTFYESAVTILITWKNLNEIENQSKNQKEEFEENIQNLTKQFNEEISTKKEQFDKLLENIEAFATSSGVSKHSDIFQTEALLHYKEAIIWLKSSIAILIAIIVVALIGAGLSIYYNNADYTIQIAISKVVILTALFYGLSITNKTYKAHKHNELMNKHRHNALTTFETFANAASADDHTKNAVLLETTRTIFSNQSTGYLKPDNEAEGTQKIIEIIKAPARGEA